MIKAIYILARNPDLSLAECHQHWYEAHGAHHVSAGHRLVGYVQHHTLLAAYTSEHQPTHDGASMVWVKDLAGLDAAEASPAWKAASVDGQEGLRGAPLFVYPMAIAIGEEKVVFDGTTNPYMVKAIFAANRNPEIGEDEFYDHWRNVHGELCTKVPGLRRYVQNHGLKEAKGRPRLTHDGWSELWFDDLDSFRAAKASREWQAMSADGRGGVDGKAVFDYGAMCFVIGRERNMMPGVFEVPGRAH
jgi:uncharacterized protein (TIGR02118 family)